MVTFCMKKRATVYTLSGFDSIMIDVIYAVGIDDVLNTEFLFVRYVMDFCLVNNV